MSRCFPYPPPGYVRNQVAEMQTTSKLQKEREMMEKKKEKKSKIKGAKQVEKLQISKHSKHLHKKRKHEDISLAGQETKKASKDSLEQLEKSGLSEEHEAPYFNQTLRDSPESSQDSSKRRKVVVTASPSQTRNGTIVRIKLPISNQRRDPESPAAMLPKPRITERPAFKQMGSDMSFLQKHGETQPLTNTVTRVNSSAAPQQQALKQGIGGGPQPSAKVAQVVDPQFSAKMTTQRVRLPPRAMPRVDPLPERVNLLLPAKLRDSPIPTKVSQKGGSTVELDHQTALLQKSKMSVELPAVKRQQVDASFTKEEPSFSGRYTAPVSVQAVQQSSLDRKSRKAEKKERKAEKKERKAEKKERKFRDVFVTWVPPPPIEMVDVDVGDQDWLFDGTKRADANMSNCRAADGPVLCQSTEQLQPRAVHLPDLHVYQLPYVVPF